MRYGGHLLSVLGLFGAIFFGAVLNAADDAQPKRHNWSLIAYPDIPSPWGPFRVSLGFGKKSDGLRLDLVLRRPGFGKKTEWPSEPKEGDIKIRLHRGDGQVVYPNPANSLGTIVVWMGDSWGSSGGVTYAFPWGKKRST